MIKCEVVEKFDLKAFKELRNIERENKEHESAKYDGKLFVNDKFECSQEMADYLTGNNPIRKAVVKVIEVEPEITINEEEIVKKVFEENKPKTTKKKKTSKK